MISNVVRQLRARLPSASWCNSVSRLPLQLESWPTASVAQARITKIQILTPPKSIAFGGYSFSGVGQYEVITGIATGEVNPNNPQNSVITDLNLAPTTNGNVVYSTISIS